MSFVSCKKTEFPEENLVPDELFKMEGSIDGEPFNLAAGNSGYYLFTDYEESYNGDYYLTSELKNTACLNCDESFKIRMKTNSGPHHGNSFDPDFISARSYPYYKNHDTEVNRIFALNSISNDDQFESVVVNGFLPQSNLQEVDINEPINLDYNYLTSGSHIDGNHWISVGNSCHANDVFYGEIFGFQIDELKENIIVYPPNFNIDGLYSWQLTWGENGEILTTSVEFTKATEFALPLNYSNEDTFFNLTLAFTSENDDLIIQNHNHIFPLNTTSIPKGSFEVILIDHIQLPSFEIEYTDAEGNVYVSSHDCLTEFHQNIENIFNITHTEAYEANEIGIPTKLVEFNASFEMVNINDGSDIIAIEDMSGTIALPIPE